MHSINLLPPAASQRFARKRTLAAWSKILLMSLLLASIAIAWGQSSAAKINQHIEIQSSLVHYPSSLQRHHATLSARLQDLEQHEQQQIELRSRYSPLVVVRLLHQLKAELGDRLVVNSIEFTEQPPASGTTEQTLHGHISLQLVAHGSTTCSDLLQRLRETSLFREVQLSSSLELVDPQKDALRFTVRCEF